jgi:uncharacterized protein with von Willebrand factor type A (vWA) domain
MFFNFVDELRAAGIPASFKEHLTLLEALDRDVIDQTPEAFYYLSRATFVKDEGLIDRFDQVFNKVFKGILSDYGQNPVDIPEDWLKAIAEKYLSEEEMEKIKALGDWDEIMETLKKRLEEQEGRHEGGDKWIGTAGTSPFGAYGYNPEGVRIGQEKSRHRKAVKVWDKREFKNLDDTVELGTRNIKVALRRLRRFAREGAELELDLPDTIKSTADNGGYLDLKMIPERHNTVKVLLLLDIGGSMDDHVRTCEELFSASRTEFKHMEYFYFHNCLYEKVWKENRRRYADYTATWEVMHTYPADYKLIFVGDATMSPYEIAYPGGSVEHWNEEPGGVWMRRLLDVYQKAIWLNPVPEKYWEFTPSIQMINQLMTGRMFPLTVEGLERGMRELSR